MKPPQKTIITGRGSCTLVGLISMSLEVNLRLVRFIKFSSLVLFAFYLNYRKQNVVVMNSTQNESNYLLSWGLTLITRLSATESVTSSLTSCRKLWTIHPDFGTWLSELKLKFSKFNNLTLWCDESVLLLRWVISS